MGRFPYKHMYCWRRLIRNWRFQDVLTFVKKYGQEKVNNQHLLVNSAYVVVFIMSSNFPSCSSNYSVVSHLFLSLSAKTTSLFAQAIKGLKILFCFFSLNQSTQLMHTKFCLNSDRILSDSGFLMWHSSFCEFCFLSYDL